MYYTVIKTLNGYKKILTNNFGDFINIINPEY